MSKQNVQTLKGFRDILPEDARKRQWVRQVLIDTAQRWGYEPIETPTLEPYELFKGEIGEDEKLFYKFTDNGDREVIMRYDQTVPTCRYVAAHLNELSLPFRRYQVQSVFRAEKPQKGRYREFTQFDLDIFCVKGPEADAEVIAENLESYLNIGFKKPVIIFNSRELMKGIPYEAIVAIDKLQKIGADGVIKDMIKKGIAQDQAQRYLDQVMNIKPDETIKTIINYLENSGFGSEYYRFEPTLARSFSYSEGPIWEIVIEDYEVGSVGGGERYDSMMERLTGQKIAATGVGLGFDRTVEAADQLGLIPQTQTTQVLVTLFDKKYENLTVKAAKQLRQANIMTELYPDSTSRIGKQFKYADKKNIPYALIIGEEEVAQNKVALKNLETGNQEILSMDEVMTKLN